MADAAKTFTYFIKAQTGDLERGFQRSGREASQLSGKLDKLGRSELDVREATIKVERAQRAAARATEKYGKESLEAAAAQVRLERAQERAARSTHRGAASVDKQSRALRGLSTAAKGAIAGIGIYGVAGAVRSVVTASIEAEKSQAKLDAQLRAIGKSSDAVRGKIDRVVQSQSLMSGFDDEALTDSFTNIVRTTGDVTKSLELNNLAMDLARAKNLDVAKAGEIVAKVAGGNTGILARYGFSLEKGATASDALALLQKKLGGQAEAYGKTQAGSIERMNTAWENLREKLGDQLAPVVTDTADRIAGFVTQMQNGTGEGAKFLDTVKGIASPVGKIARSAGEFVKNNPELAKAAASFAIIGGAAGKLGKLTGASGLIKFGFGRGNTIATPLYVKEVNPLGSGAGAGGAAGRGGRAAAAGAAAARVAGSAAILGVVGYGGARAAGASQNTSAKVGGALAGARVGATLGPVGALGGAVLGGAAGNIVQQTIAKSADTKSLKEVERSLGVSRRDAEALRLSMSKFGGDLSKVSAAKLVALATALSDTGWASRDARTKVSGLVETIRRELGERAIGQVTHSWDALKGRTRTTLADINRTVARNMARVRSVMESDSNQGARALRENIGGAVGAVERAMSRGTVSVETGMRRINQLLSSELKQLGVTYLSADGKSPAIQAGALPKPAPVKGRGPTAGTYGNEQGGAALDGRMDGPRGGTPRTTRASGGTFPARGPAAKLRDWLANKGFATTSEGRSDSNTYHGMGLALDYGTSSNDLSKLAKILWPARRQFEELFIPTWAPHGGLYHHGNKFTNGELQAGHQDHIHVAEANSFQPPEIQIPRVRMRKGLGALTAIGQAALDKARKAAVRRGNRLVEAGGQEHPLVRGKVSWFGGPRDQSDSGRTALGLTTATPGVAVRPGAHYNSGQPYLGGYWRITAPNGKTSVLRQTDIGPNQSTGRRIDLTYSALGRFGYTEGNFPTDQVWKAYYLGKDADRAKASKASGGSAGAPFVTVKSPGADQIPPGAVAVGRDPKTGAMRFRNTAKGSPGFGRTFTVQRGRGDDRMLYRTYGTRRDLVGLGESVKRTAIGVDPRGKRATAIRRATSWDAKQAARIRFYESAYATAVAKRDWTTAKMTVKAALKFWRGVLSRAVANGDADGISGAQAQIEDWSGRATEAATAENVWQAQDDKYATDYTLATLTPDTKDDVAAATAGRDYWNTRIRQYQYGLAHGDSRVTGAMLSDAIGQRDTYQGYLDSGSASADDTSVKELLKNIQSALDQQNQRAALVGGLEAGVLKKAITDVVTGQIGGASFLAMQTPGSTGQLARY